MKEFDEILSNKLQRMASIAWSVIQKPNIEINKSITDDLNYGIRSEAPKEVSNNGILVSKKGKEIKESLQKELTLCAEHKASLFKEMDELVEKINIVPTGNFKDDYEGRGWIGKVDMPKKYIYSQMYSTSDIKQSEGETLPEASNVPVDKNICTQMQGYNELARKYLIASIEAKKLQTIINYIDENKTFKLTVDVASKLGF